MAFGGPASPGDNKDGLQSGTQIKTIREIISHPEFSYSQGFYSQDLALVLLEKPFDFTELVKPICLSEEDVLPTQKCFVAGWSYPDEGKLREGNPFVKPNL